MHPQIGPELAKQHAAHVARRIRMEPRPAPPVSAAPPPVPVPVPEPNSAPDMEIDIGFVSGAFAISSQIRDETIPPRLTVAAVVHAVVDSWGGSVSFADVMSTSRLGPIVHRRQMSAFLARELVLYINRPITRPMIGRAMGGRDHTTILHAWHRTLDRILCGDEDTLIHADDALDMLRARGFSVPDLTARELAEPARDTKCVRRKSTAGDSREAKPHEIP
jgi:hypothetical protein